jgi:indole-3-glycerol phosphate synthase
MSSYLDGILSWHRARAAEDRRDLETLARLADAQLDGAPPTGTATAVTTGTTFSPRPFTASLLGSDAPAIIAEVKRRSPSKGDLDPDLDPAVMAVEYAEGGAACLSVLTDARHFAGSPADLIAARGATTLPVLRKDFTVCAADLYDARIMGADAVLLIVAALSDPELVSFLALAEDLRLDALVEVHDLTEVERALSAGAGFVGVNQRDLRSFEVDTERAERLAGALLPGIVKVAESGIRSRHDVARLGEAGYDAVLVGELLVRSADRVGAVRALHAPVGEVRA